MRPLTDLQRFGAISVGGHGSRPISDINVTPLVDVVLVLLVVFMITAPLVSKGVNVDLPQARAEQIASDAKPVEISVDATGQTYLGADPIARDRFASTMLDLARASGDPQNVRIFVRADRSLDYGRVMGVASDIARAGFRKVAFLADSQPALGAKVAP